MLGTYRLLLLQLTVGSAVDLSGYTHERRKLAGASPRYARPGGRSAEFISTAPPALSLELLDKPRARLCGGKIYFSLSFIFIYLFFFTQLAGESAVNEGRKKGGGLFRRCLLRKCETSEDREQQMLVVNMQPAEE